MIRRDGRVDAFYYLMLQLMRVFDDPRSAEDWVDAPLPCLGRTPQEILDANGRDGVLYLRDYLNRLPAGRGWATLEALATLTAMAHVATMAAMAHVAALAHMAALRDG